MNIFTKIIFAILLVSGVFYCVFFSASLKIAYLNYASIQQRQSILSGILCNPVVDDANYSDIVKALKYVENNNTDISNLIESRCIENLMKSDSRGAYREPISQMAEYIFLMHTLTRNPDTLINYINQHCEDNSTMLNINFRIHFVYNKNPMLKSNAVDNLLQKCLHSKSATM